MDQTRRRFLRTTGLGVIGSGLGLSLPGVGYGFGGFPSFLPADGSGPANVAANIACSGDSLFPPVSPIVDPGKRVLEIVLYGGLSPWETFWVAGGDGAMFTDADTGAQVAVDMKGAGDLVKNFPWCDVYPASGQEIWGPEHPDHVKEFALDETGQPIYWGPATAPLWTDEILSHARVITLDLKDPVHELCMPVALTGLGLGNPRAAGLGAAISRTYREKFGSEDASRPYAYVLTPENFGTFAGITAPIFATGRHGGANRPVGLPVGLSGLGDLFLEAQPDSARVEALRALRDQYRQRLRWQGDPGPVGDVRSPQFGDYATSAATLEKSSKLHNLVGGNALKAGPGSACMQELFDGFEGTNVTARALEVAGDLLDPCQGNARYVAVMDRGFKLFGGAPYDSHNHDSIVDQHVPMTLGNLYNCLFHLRKQIDLGRINLDETLVVLTTEMGRRPFLGSTNGRDHWAPGTVQILLGSPGQRGIAGTMKNSVAKTFGPTAESLSSFEAQHARAAILIAAGVDPITTETFQQSELRSPFYLEGTAYGGELSADIAERLLGVEMEG